MDYKYSRLVANRLVREAEQRQVIIFTHDIHFLMELRNRAGASKIPLCTQVIRRDASGIGLCDQELPWIAENTKKRIGVLRKAHQECSAHYNRLGSDSEYERMVERCYGQMRETWERAVEEVLLNATIVRFEPDVHTSQLSSVLIEDADFASIESGMTKSSRWLCGHDAAGSAPEPVPTPDELNTDIDLLDSFVSRVRKRNDSVKKNRKTT
jgi:hypothetical protein